MVEDIEGLEHDVSELLQHIFDTFDGANKKHVMDVLASALLSFARSQLAMSRTEVCRSILKGNVLSTGDVN